MTNRQKGNQIINKIAQLLAQLSPAEYLDYIIETHYIKYQEMNILLSIYDTDSRLKFASSAIAKLFKIKTEEYNYGGLPSNVAYLDEIKDYVLFHEKMIKECLETKRCCAMIIFEKFRGVIGSMHSRYDPLFDYNGNICGVTLRSFDVTNLIWGLFESTNNEIGNQIYDLSKLTRRQQEILFLSAINHTQIEISEMLKIDRGSVSKTISNICKKFGFEHHSINFLVNTLGRKYIIQNIDIPSQLSKPFIIKLDHDKSDGVYKIIDWTKISY